MAATVRELQAGRKLVTALSADTQPKSDSLANALKKVDDALNQLAALYDKLGESKAALQGNATKQNVIAARETCAQVVAKTSMLKTATGLASTFKVAAGKKRKPDASWTHVSGKSAGTGFRCQLRFSVEAMCTYQNPSAQVCCLNMCACASCNQGMWDELTRRFAAVVFAGRRK